MGNNEATGDGKEIRSYNRIIIIVVIAVVDCRLIIYDAMGLSTKNSDF